MFKVIPDEIMASLNDVTRLTTAYKLQIKLFQIH